MNQKPSLSIVNGFLFLLNIIVGTGVFLNTIPLCQVLGKHSCLAYALTGLCMVPIIVATYFLAHQYPGYNMAQLLEVNFGRFQFILTPLYALAKLSTSVIAMLFISNLIQKIFFNNGSIPFYIILSFVYLFFFFFVYCNISLHALIQRMIIVFKLIPLCIILGYCLYRYYVGVAVGLVLPAFNFFDGSLDYYKLAGGASITIFAFSGFESLFAITPLLQEKKRAAYLLFCGFFTALLLYILYQFSVSYLLHMSQGYPIDGMTLLEMLGVCLSSCSYDSLFLFLIQIAILFSSLGVAQGVLYMVINTIYGGVGKIFCNNIIYVKHFVFSVVILYLYIGSINIFILQQMSSLGTIVLYFLFLLSFSKGGKYKIVSVLGFLSILLFFIIHVYNAYYYFGFTGYIMYGILCMILFLLYFLKRVNKYEC
jgi:hypothetical protein